MLLLHLISALLPRSSKNSFDKATLYALLLKNPQTQASKKTPKTSNNQPKNTPPQDVAICLKSALEEKLTGNVFCSAVPGITDIKSDSLVSAP